WDAGASSRRQLAERLYPTGGAAGYTTVQKLLEPLETKGCVAPVPRSNPRTFAATVTRDELIARSLRDVADKLCDGSLTPLLSNLVEGRPMTPRANPETADLP